MTTMEVCDLVPSVSLSDNAERMVIGASFGRRDFQHPCYLKYEQHLLFHEISSEDMSSKLPRHFFDNNVGAG